MEKYVKTDASIHVHWFRKIEDKGVCYFFSFLFQTENRILILAGYIKW